MPRRVSLPMYDLPELRWATDAWWGAVRAGLLEEGAAAGLSRQAEVPHALDRAAPHHQVWADPHLLLSQMCGYPLVTHFAGRVQLVATPTHDLEGSAGGRYTSTVLVREDSPARTLGELRGARVAANEPDSHSGMNALRSLIAPLAAGDGGPRVERPGGGVRFFGEVVWTGAHRRSFELVGAGRVDAACIDSVTCALTARVRPDLTAGLRVLARSAPVPAPAYVTRAGATPAEVAALQRALVRAAADPDPATVRARRALLITGIEPLPLEAYREISRIERAAESLGYPTLA